MFDEKHRSRTSRCARAHVRLENMETRIVQSSKGWTHECDGKMAAHKKCIHILCKMNGCFPSKSVGSWKSFEWNARATTRRMECCCSATISIEWTRWDFFHFVVSHFARRIWLFGCDGFGGGGHRPSTKWKKKTFIFVKCAPDRLLVFASASALAAQIAGHP